MSIPILDTERLILRDFRLEDFSHYAAMWSNQEFVRHMGDGTPRSEEESWASFLRIGGHWQMMKFGSWAVQEKASGRLIGSVGFNERKRDRGVALKGVPETGWAIAAEAGGKGYATEALRAALNWGKVNFGPRRVIALIGPENVASMRVATKCSFAEHARILSAGRPRIVFDRIL